MKPRKVLTWGMSNIMPDTGPESPGSVLAVLIWIVILHMQWIEFDLLKYDVYVWAWLEMKSYITIEKGRVVFHSEAKM